jgi:hypothetical protein
MRLPGYLQLHQDFALTNSASDEFCYRLSVAEFAAKVLRLLQLARASIIYLSLAVHAEERDRKKKVLKKGLPRRRGRFHLLQGTTQRAST